MSPEVAATRLGWSLGLGILCGIAYDFLDTPGRRFRKTCDGIFVLFFFRCWLELSFRICRGDIRLGCYLGMLAGVFLWQWRFGATGKGLFRRFWKMLAAIGAFLLFPVKKIFGICKNFVCICEKMGYNKVYAIFKKDQERR